MAKHNRNYSPEDIRFPDQHITESNLVDEMEKSYIEYAMTILSTPFFDFFRLFCFLLYLVVFPHFHHH